MGNYTSKEVLGMAMQMEDSARMFGPHTIP